jgi:glutamate racemase
VSNARPIGVFDSGVGGLSVLREIRRELPDESALYVADSGYAPYGDRPATYIEERADVIVDFLISRDAKAVVVACNTATSVAVERLRARHALPIVAIEPAVKPAVTSTRTGIVGVLATTVTLQSPNVVRLLATYGAGTTVISQPCPGLVDLVEQGDVSSAAARDAIARYVTPLVERGADTLVLGCTHYVFLEPLVREVAGPHVAVVNPAPAVARQVRRRLEAQDLLALPGAAPSEQFFCSGDERIVSRVLTTLWGRPVSAESLPPEVGLPAPGAESPETGAAR